MWEGQPSEKGFLERRRLNWILNRIFPREIRAHFGLKPGCVWVVGSAGRVELEVRGTECLAR